MGRKILPVLTGVAGACAHRPGLGRFPRVKKGCHAWGTDVRAADLGMKVSCGALAQGTVFKSLMGWGEGQQGGPVQEEVQTI